MKRSFAILAAVVCAAVSCDKAELAEVPASGNVKTAALTITSGIPETKALHGVGDESGTSFAWEAGRDKINLFYERNNGSYVSFNGPVSCENKTSGSTATFQPSSEEASVATGDVLYAIYPESASDMYPYYDSEKQEDIYCFRTSFGSTMQVGDNNTRHMDALDIMISRPVTVTDAMKGSEGYNVNMEFAHLFSKVKMTVVNSYDTPLTIRSLTYHSSKSDDLMSGVIYMNVKTREVYSDIREYGDCAPSANAILQVDNVTVPVGGSATLWMWMMPLDFTAGNADGRKASIYLNTSAGIFHVDNVNFDQAFTAGKTYRQKFTATADKKMEGYTFVPDAAFVEALLGSAYDYMADSLAINFYDFSLSKVGFPGFNPWGSDPEVDKKCATGLFLKNSELEDVTDLNIEARNAVSFEGLQTFKNVQNLQIMTGSDMSSVLYARSLDVSTMTDLESLTMMSGQMSYLNLSNNRKLKYLYIERAPRMDEIAGLAGNEVIEEIYLDQVGGMNDGFTADFSGCKNLKNLTIGKNSTAMVKDLNISNLDLDNLALSLESYDNVKMDGIKAKDVELFSSSKLPAIPQGMRCLNVSNMNFGDNGLASQIGSISGLDSLIIMSNYNWGFDLAFSAQNSSLKMVDLYLYECSDDSKYGGSISGLEHLTSVDSLGLKCFREKEGPALNCDLSGLSACRKLDVSFNGFADMKTFLMPKSPVLEYASVNLGGAHNSFEINGLDALKQLYISSQSIGKASGSITIGNLPSLSFFQFSAPDTPMLPVFAASSYPELQWIQIFSKYSTQFPIYADEEMNKKYGSESDLAWVKHTHNVFPAVTSLSFSLSSDMAFNGIGQFDLRPFDKLTSFYAFWKYYNATGDLVNLPQQSVWITKTQESYVNSNSGRFRVAWYYSWRNYGRVDITSAYNSSYGYGNYAKVFDDIAF